MDEGEANPRHVRAFYSINASPSKLLIKRDSTHLTESLSRFSASRQQQLLERLALSNLGFLLYHLLTGERLLEESPYSYMYLTQMRTSEVLAKMEENLANWVSPQCLDFIKLLTLGSHLLVKPLTNVIEVAAEHPWVRENGP